MQRLKNRQIDEKITKLWGALRDTPTEKKEQIQKLKEQQKKP